MIINNRNVCDNCFEFCDSNVCECCGFTRADYKVGAGVLPVGTVLKKRYHIGKVLGKGGFGVTYKAYDDREQMIVAIKEYYPNGLAHRDIGTTQVSVPDSSQSEGFETGAKKFYDEASTISRFNGNPNIVGVYDFFYENGTAYFVMEYLDGMDLKHYIKMQGGKLTQENVVHIASVVSDALVIAHSMNVLHRDISPDNIYITQDGKIKLIDFGAARQVMGQQSKSLSVILKQGFAPLEQYQRKGKQGAWTDIYALGATLYYALTGQIPDDATERIDEPDLGKAEDYGINEELWAIIDKCMAVRIDDRYKGIVDFKQDLNQLSIHQENIIPPTRREIEQATEQTGNSIKLDGQNVDSNATVAMNMTDMALSPRPQNSYRPSGQMPQNSYPPSRPMTQGNHPQKNDSTKAIKVILIIFIILLMVVVFILGIFVCIKMISKSSKNNITDNTQIESTDNTQIESTEKSESGTTKASTNVGYNTYENLKAHYLVDYPEDYKLTELSDTNVLFLDSDDANFQVAIEYNFYTMGNSAIYSADDFNIQMQASNGKVLNDWLSMEVNLLSTRQCQGEIAGEDGYCYEFSCEGEGEVYHGELYICSGLGDYGCYSYQWVVKESSGKLDEYKELAKTMLGTFAITDAYQHSWSHISQEFSEGENHKLDFLLDDEFTGSVSPTSVSLLIYPKNDVYMESNIAIYKDYSVSNYDWEQERDLATNYYFTYMENTKYVMDLTPVTMGRHPCQAVQLEYDNNGQHYYTVIYMFYYNGCWWHVDAEATDEYLEDTISEATNIVFSLKIDDGNAYNEYGYTLQ